MNKDELVTNIKQWISLDEEIKNLQREIKKKRNEKKENTENERVATMKIIMHCTLKDQTSSSSYKHERAPDQPFQVILQHLFPRP